VSGYTLVCVVGGSVVDVRALVNFVEWHFVEQEEGVVVRLFGGGEQIKYVLQTLPTGQKSRSMTLRDYNALDSDQKKELKKMLEEAITAGNFPTGTSIEQLISQGKGKGSITQIDKSTINNTVNSNGKTAQLQTVD